MQIIPTDKVGENNLYLEMEEKGEIIEEPNELIGKRLDFNIIIGKASLPEYFCTDTYAEYKLFFCINNENSFITKKVKFY